METLAQRADAELGLPATALTDPEWRRLANYIAAEYAAGQATGPLILAGHSLGGDDQVRVAKLLNTRGVSVDLLVLIDPNAPPAIPPNVKRCVVIFKSRLSLDAVPIFRGVSARASAPDRTALTNVDLRTAHVGFKTNAIDHFNISQNPGVQDMVLAEIAQVCRPREH